LATRCCCACTDSSRESSTFCKRAHITACMFITVDVVKQRSTFERLVFGREAITGPLSLLVFLSYMYLSTAGESVPLDQRYSRLEQE
jgi:hypothetical protein